MHQQSYSSAGSRNSLRFLVFFPILRLFSLSFRLSRLFGSPLIIPRSASVRPSTASICVYQRVASIARRPCFVRRSVRILHIVPVGFLLIIDIVTITLVVIRALCMTVTRFLAWWVYLPCVPYRSIYHTLVFIHPSSGRESPRLSPSFGSLYTSLFSCIGKAVFV